MEANKKIKITFVVTRFLRTGPINQTYYIIKNLDKNLFDVSIIALFPEAKESRIDLFKELKIPVIQLNIKRSLNPLAGRELVKDALLNINPDIVQAVGIPPYRMTLTYNNCVHLVTLRNYCYEDYPSKYGKIKGYLMAFLDVRLIKKQIKKGEPFVTCSESLSKMYKDRMGLDISYIRNGVDISMFSKKTHDKELTLKKQLDLPENKLIFVYSGLMTDRKNQIEAIEGFLLSNISRDAVLVLLGDGDNYESLKNQFGHNKNIIFKGKVSNVAEYLTVSDIYLSTSKSEGLPNGVLEAMSVGLPILLSDISQHMELLNVCPNMGLSYNLGKKDNLSNKIDEIAKMDLAAMGDAAYQCVMDNFTDCIMSEQYQTLYKKIAHK